MFLENSDKGVLKGFYLMNEGLSLFSKEYVDFKLNPQLFGGMISALDTFSSELTGSSIQSFSTSNAMVNIKILPKNYKFVVFTKLDIKTSELAPLLDELTSLLEKSDFFSTHDHSELINENEHISILMTNILETFNSLLTSKYNQTNKIQTQGKIKFLYTLFKNDIIKVWRALIVGKRIIITGLNAEKISIMLNSLLLLHLKDSFYHIIENVEPKNIELLQNQKHYIASTGSSFILMMRKDLWDVHIDVDKSKINFQAGGKDPDKYELSLFSGLLSLAEFEGAKEEDLRKYILGINSSVLSMKNIIESSKSDVKSIVKKLKIPQSFYDNILSQVKIFKDNKGGN